MALMIVDRVKLVHHVATGQLGYISEDRAGSPDGLDVNHDYSDLRGMSLADLQDILECETEIFNQLEANSYTEDAIETADEEWLEAYLLPGIDFGMGSAVTALSALGCIPITSCRGLSLGGSHQHIAPTVCFYADKSVVPLLIALAGASEVSLENNSDMLELYTSDLRRMRRFAEQAMLALGNL